MKTEKYEAVDAIAEVCKVDRIDVTAALALMTGETCTISQARDIANLYANKKAYQLNYEIEENEVIMQEQAKEIVRLREALREIVECTGTSTLQNKIAREAIIDEDGKDHVGIGG